MHGVLNMTPVVIQYHASKKKYSAITQYGMYYYAYSKVKHSSVICEIHQPQIHKYRPI